MNDDEYIASIKTMSLREWMTEILDNPEYLTDPYYKKFRVVLYRRGHELLEQLES